MRAFPPSSEVLGALRPPVVNLGMVYHCFADIRGIWIYGYMYICIYAYMYICTYTYARVYARVYDPHGIYRLYLLQKWLRSSENRSATDPIGPSRHKDIIVHTSPKSIATGS